MVTLGQWLDEQAGAGAVWYAKRLSGNDTLANGTHQAGPYFPKQLLFDLLPSLNRPDLTNPDQWFQLNIPSHNDSRTVRAIWYNNRLHGGTRNEARVTNFGGGSSPLLDPESTGALVVFSFLQRTGASPTCSTWVCRNPEEEDAIEEMIGPVEPGQPRVWSLAGTVRRVEPVDLACDLTPEQLPASWLSQFPTGQELALFAKTRKPMSGKSPDERLLARRACEYEVFQSLESATELPRIKAGFTTIEQFVSHASSLLQRRKARAGRSLELHTRFIFEEENLKEGLHFSAQPTSDPGKKPDFLFPSEAAYADPSFPAEKLRVLAIKTTCKDRWRQVINEADRIKQKHLLTLQEGVSEAQFREMKEAGVQLVVPAPLRKSFPAAVQPELMTFGEFLGGIRQVANLM